ncbi:MAG TPA: hypothetical protein VH575_26535 [Gemmataceae bacterium]
MKNWFDRFADWWEGLPGWGGLLLFPVVAPLILASSCVALLIFLLFQLPFLLILGAQRMDSPTAKFTLAEVREHAVSLNRWFVEMLKEDPDASNYLGVGPELAEQLAQLAGQTKVDPEMATQLAQRVRQELTGHKGTPFLALHHLSRRLAELAMESSRGGSQAEHLAPADRPRE